MAVPTQHSAAVMNSRTTPHILVIDDDPSICDLVREYLVDNGMRVSVGASGRDLFTLLDREAIDLVLLDLRLPDEDGMQLARQLRERATVPIVLLTGRSEEADRVMGLELGADDYVCKPFSPREIVARAKAILRRLQPRSEGAQRIRLGKIELDGIAHQARVDGQLLTLTPIEFSILLAMVEQPRRVWSRAQLLERARGTDFAGYERNIDTHVKNLRKKLREHLSDRDPIRSVYGVGYALDTETLE